MAEFLCCSPESVTILLTSYSEEKVNVLVIQSCPTLCNPMDCSLPGSSVCGILQGNYTRVGCHSLGDLPNPGLNPGLPHCKQVLYQLSHQGI